MFCGITGVPPSEPVVSRLNGALYDRKVIEAYIEKHHRDPHTNEPLALTDLIPVRSGAATGPRAVAASTIPGLLAQLQGEWDAVMLEQFSLRQQLAAAQQELSHALFKHDAACRVIAKLVAERDEARRVAGVAGEAERVASAHEASVSARDKGAADGNTGPAGLPESVVAELNTHNERLRAARKRREVAREVPTPADFDFYTESADLVPSHMTSTGTPTGVSCVAISEVNGMQAVFSGGTDGKAICYDVGRQSAVASLLGHQGPIRDIETALDFVVTCSDDSTTRVWRSEVGNYRCAMTLKGHRGAVNGLCILPSYRQVITAGVDGLLNFHDIESGVVVGSGRAEGAVGFATAALHPDGMIAATAIASSVQLWDLRSMDVDVPMPLPGKLGQVSTISFSSNGWAMALGTTAGVVQVYDLRKGAEAVIDTLNFEDVAARKPHVVSEVSFDPSGQYLGVATNNLKVYHTSDIACDLLQSFSNHLQPVTCLAWGGHAKWLASGSLDRHVKVWAPARQR